MTHGVVSPPDPATGRPALMSNGREIWFERWSGGYNPIHWKGWAAVLGALAAGLAGAGLAILALHWLGHGDAAGWGVLPLGIAVVLLPWIAARHCDPRT